MDDHTQVDPRVFDPADLLQRTAAVQLCPPNAQRLLRLEYLSALAASLPNEPGKPWMSAQRFRRTVESGLGIASYEDPVTWPVVESMAFFGGAYLVLPGLTEQIRPGLDLLLMSALLDPDLNDLGAVRTSIAHPCQALLRLSNAMCMKAGLNRGQAPGSSKCLVVPPGPALGTLVGAVSWTQAALDQLYAGTNLSSTALTPFETTFGAPSPQGVEPQDWALLSRPLVRTAARLIVGMPHAMITAMQRYVLTCAHQHSALARLSRSFHEGTVRKVDRSLDLMGLPLLQEKFQPASTNAHVTQQLRILDRGKLLHVLIVSDDFTNFLPSEAAGQGRFPDAAELDGMLAAGLTMASTLTPPATEILGLVVSSGVGRFATIGMNGGADTQDVLPFTLQDLTSLSFLEQSNPLYLWHFARARRRMRQQAEVHAWSLGDELFFYRRKDSSFYLSDDKVNFITLQPNEGYALLQEVQDRYDPHAIATAWGGFQECVRVHTESRLPIYCPRMPDPLRPAQCVDLTDGAIWITTALNPHGGSEVAEDVAIRAVDAIAFWLARMSTRDAVRQAALRHLHIEVVTERAGEWTHPTEPPVAGSGASPPVVRVVGPAHVQLVLQPDFMTTVSRSEDSPDRVLLTVLLGHLSPDVDPQDSATAVSAAMPTEYHRRSVTLTTETVAAAFPRSLPPKHLVPVAAEQEVLDGMTAIFDTLGVVEGEIPADRRVSVLNGVVQELYKLLVQEIAALSPKGLLEWLVAHNEAVIDALSLTTKLEPFNMACFADDAGSAKEFADRLADLSKADQAGRFLIEFVAAQPPQGAALISYGAYDRLLALVSKIIFFGMVSDDVCYGSDDPDLSRLPTGRLGTARSNRQRARGQFMEAHGASERARLLRRELVTDPEPVRRKRDRARQAITEASEGEFGFSLDTHDTILSIVIEECARQGRATAEISLTQLTSEIAKELNVTALQSQQWLETISLVTRQNFFAVPPPGTRGDVYPWRYNRRWSYLRRPLIVRGDSAVCGSSHVFRAGGYLSSLCFSGRLKATSDKMKAALGGMTEIAGYRFNATIAEMCRAVPGVLVAERAEQFGGIRLESPTGDALGDIDVLVVDAR